MWTGIDRHVTGLSPFTSVGQGRKYIDKKIASFETCLLYFFDYKIAFSTFQNDYK